MTEIPERIIKLVLQKYPDFNERGEVLEIIAEAIRDNEMSVDSELKKMNTNFTSLDANITGLNTSIAGLDTKLGKLDSIETLLKQIVEKLDGLSKG